LKLDDAIHRHAQYVLDLNRGNKLRAARQLGISRSTLYRILGNEALFAP
jgi:transcriptional regulator of acetoin/glycerol metabolism